MPFLSAGGRGGGSASAAGRGVLLSEGRTADTPAEAGGRVTAAGTDGVAWRPHLRVVSVSAAHAAPQSGDTAPGRALAGSALTPALARGSQGGSNQPGPQTRLGAATQQLLPPGALPPGSPGGQGPPSGCKEWKSGSGTFGK